MARPRKNDEVMDRRFNIRLTSGQEALIREAFPGVNTAGTSDITREILLLAAQLRLGVIEGAHSPESAAQDFVSYFRGAPEVKRADFVVPEQEKPDK